MTEYSNIMWLGIAGAVISVIVYLGMVHIALLICALIADKLYIVYNFAPVATPRQMDGWMNTSTCIFSFKYKHYVWLWRKTDAALYKLVWQ